MDNSIRGSYHHELLSIPTQDCGSPEDLNSETQSQANPANHVDEAHHLLPSESTAQSASDLSENVSVTSTSGESFQDQKGSAAVQKKNGEDLL